MKNLLKKEKGITLIALVVTTVIILILAAVAVSMITGNDGLFSKANEAGTLYNEKAVVEKEHLNDLLSHIDGWHSENPGNNNNTVKPDYSEFKYTISSNLQSVLNESKMSINGNDILNTPAIMDNAITSTKISPQIEALIPIVSVDSVVKDKTASIATYNDSYGGIIRANGEYNSSFAWQAFDNDVTTKAGTTSANNYGGSPSNFYVEYEFKEPVCAIKAKFQIDNLSRYSGTRGLVIQGFEDELNKWENLTDKIVQTGTETTFKETNVDLKNIKAYKRYRIYINQSSGTDSGTYSSYVRIFQLYGLNSQKIKEYQGSTEKILANLEVETITLEQMITNVKFVNQIIPLLSSNTLTNYQNLIIQAPRITPFVDATKVTKNTNETIATYNDSYGGVIRANGEYNSNLAWYAFDNDFQSKCGTTSANGYGGDPADFYVEYEFPRAMYAVRTIFKLSNNSSTSGTRSVVIQGYNETTSSWENLSETLSQSGTATTFPENDIELNYTNSYKRYRVYVNASSGTTSSKQSSYVCEFQLFGIPK